jgi:hypothetical protein
MLSLVVAKGFISRLLRNENIHGHLKRHHWRATIILAGVAAKVLAGGEKSEAA